MNSRERVKITLNHEEPDRIPIDFGSIPSTSISIIAYNRLKEYLGLKINKTKVLDMWQQLALVDIEIRDYFKIDTVGLWPEKKRKEAKLASNILGEIPENWKSKMLENGSEIHVENGIEMAKRPAEGYYFDPIYKPLEKATLEDLDNFVWPSQFSFYRVPDPENLNPLISGLKKRGKFLYKNSDLAIVGNFGGSVFETACGLRGFDNFLIDLVNNKKFAAKLLDKIVKNNIEYFKKYNDAVGEYIQVIMLGGEDLGSQRNLLISPNLYREMIKPKQEELWQFIKKNCDAKLLVHSCGAISDIINDFQEIGMDILNPVQTSAKNMNPEELKTMYGNK